MERRTAEQAAALGDVENNVSRVDERAMEADRKAGAAGQAAQQAQTSADAARGRADEAHQMADQTRSRLTDVVGNLDNYQHVTTESIYFALNKHKLTKEEMQKLDDAVAKLQGNNNYVLEIQGYTDKTGSAAKNLELSRKRADEVVRYVTTKHNIPLRRVHVLGVGEDIPNADNSTREARKQNRRVDINVYARAIEGAATTTGAANTSSMGQGSMTQDRSRPASTGTGSTGAAQSSTQGTTGTATQQ
ncbi:MAG TPA: OmpA family protein [Bryobacteraceae bacterium]|nr:OmpA family protein [Bryobacteraceae bacterium]